MADPVIGAHQRSLSDVLRITPLDSRIAASLAFMQANLGRTLSMRELGRTCGLSESRFRHLFRLDTGIPPKTALTRLRIQYAEALLTTTDTHTKEIAARVGLPMSTFMRVFKVHRGTTPAKRRLRSTSLRSAVDSKAQIADSETF
jgi:transcriptional regulator GlxA family with amidase domain